MQPKTSFSESGGSEFGTEGTEKEMECELVCFFVLPFFDRNVESVFGSHFFFLSRPLSNFEEFASLFFLFFSFRATLTRMSSSLSSSAVAPFFYAVASIKVRTSGVSRVQGGRKRETGKGKA